MAEKTIEDLKKSYAEIQRKFDLPSFEDMNEDFYIEKIYEHETDILIREVRKFVGDKLANYMRFVENLLNPVNVPMFVFSVVKMLDDKNKKDLSEIYKRLADSEIEFIKLDLEFSEKSEAEYIKKSMKLWNEIKGTLMKIMEKVEAKGNIKPGYQNKSYFG